MRYWAHVRLARFVSTALCMALESMVLDLPYLAWESRFSQPNISSFIWLLYYNQIFLVATIALWTSSNSWIISSWIRLHCIFVCGAFKSHMEWRNAHVSAPTSTTLTTTAGTYHSFNYFDDAIYTQQTSTYQNICKAFKAPDWFGLVWFYGILTIVGYLMPNPFLYI